MAMTTAQRRLVVRTLRTLALVVATGAVFAGYIVWPSGYYAPSHGSVKWIPSGESIGYYIVAVALFGAPFLLVAAVLWFVAAFVRAGGD
jgi:hypothetical protein